MRFLFCNLRFTYFFFYQCYSAWVPLVQKVTKSRYVVIVWTFSTNELFSPPFLVYKLFSIIKGSSLLLFSIFSSLFSPIFSFVFLFFSFILTFLVFLISFSSRLFYFILSSIHFCLSSYCKIFYFFFNMVWGIHSITVINIVFKSCSKSVAW